MIGRPSPETSSVAIPAPLRSVPLRGRPILMAICLLASACNPSQVDPSATVTITGQLQNQSGDPVAGRKVILAPQVQAPELLGGLLFTALSLGTLCLADPPPEPCASFLRGSNSADSDAGGNFAFSLEGKEVRTFFGNARTMGVSSGLPAPPGALEGPAVLQSFAVQTEQLDLGALKFWEPTLAPARGKAQWDQTPKELGGGTGYQLEFTSDDGKPIWSGPATAARAEYDPRALEDSRGRVAVTASREGVALGTTTDTSYRSAQLPFSSLEGAPPSRGKPCSLQTGNGPPAPLPSCRATDGRLSDPADIPPPEETQRQPGSSPPPPPEPQGLVIDVGRAGNVSLVVLRGCACTVESSVDGSAWSSVGTASTSEAEIKPQRSTRARFVRVGGQGQPLSGLREVSIWT